MTGAHCRLAVGLLFPSVHILYRIPVVTGAIDLLCYLPPLQAHMLAAEVGVRRAEFGNFSNVVNGTTALVRVNWNAVIADFLPICVLTAPRKLLNRGRVTEQALPRLVQSGFPLQKLLVLSVYVNSSVLLVHVFRKHRLKVKARLLAPLPRTLVVTTHRPHKLTVVLHLSPTPPEILLYVLGLPDVLVFGV